jgi:hypothetical protein
MKRLRECSVAFLIFLWATLGQAARNPVQRVHAFASLPDWTGYWEQDSFKLDISGEPANLDEGYAVSKLWFADPPYNPEWEARYKATPEPPDHVYCKWGFPAIMESPYTQFELVLTPEQTGPIGDRNQLSDQAHFVERIRLLDKDRMEDQMIIEDPVAFARPWRVTLTFKRMKGVDRLLPLDCQENDRNPLVNGEFKIAPPKP